MYVRPQTKQYASDAIVSSNRIEQTVVVHSDPKTPTLSTRSQIQNNITYCIHFCEILGKAELLYTIEVDYWLQGSGIHSYRGLMKMLCMLNGAVVTEVYHLSKVIKLYS